MSSILVVDDEVGMRELVQRLLIAQGYLTLGARTAEEALDLLALTPDIHVVVADLEMPGRGGAWLIEHLSRKFPLVGVVLATANDAAPGSLTLRSTVVRYLVKPITTDDLLIAVMEALNWHQQQEARSRDQIGEAVEAWLDKKLTRGHGDGGDSTH